MQCFCRWDSHWRSLCFEALSIWPTWWCIETTLCFHGLVCCSVLEQDRDNLVDVCGACQWWAHSRVIAGNWTFCHGSSQCHHMEVFALGWIVFYQNGISSLLPGLRVVWGNAQLLPSCTGAGVGSPQAASVNFSVFNMALHCCELFLLPLCPELCH